MPSIKTDIEDFWNKILVKNTNYPCLLKSVELNEAQEKKYGYPRIRYQVLEVDEVAEGVLKTNLAKDDNSITEKYVFNARYLLDFDLYFKSDKYADIDNLKMLISNKLLMSRISQNYDYSGKKFKKLVLRDNLGERPIEDYFQDQTISRYNYQQPFIVEIIRTNDLAKAKEATITEKDFKGGI